MTTYSPYQPYQSLVPGVRSLIAAQEGINEKQLMDMLDISRMDMPVNAAPSISQLNDERQAAMLKLLGDTDWSKTPMGNYTNPETMKVLQSLESVANNLTNARSDYSAGQMDFSRGMTRAQQAFADRLSKANMFNTVSGAIQGRRANAATTEIGRQADYTNINKRYEYKMAELRRQAEEARRKGDKAALVRIFGAIGALAGTVLSGGNPIVGGAVGSAIVGGGSLF